MTLYSKVRAYGLAALVAVGGLILSVTGFVLTRQADEVHIRFELAGMSGNYAARLRQALALHMEIIEATASFMSASQGIDRNAFHKFTLQVIARQPGVLAIRWMPRVRHKDRGAFEEKTRRLGIPGFEITDGNDPRRESDRHPAANRDVYFPVVFAEPEDGAAWSIGYDSALAPRRMKILDQARDSGVATMSGRTLLLQSGSFRRGVLVFSPVFEGGRQALTQTDRREWLRGFVMAVLDVDFLMEQAMSSAPLPGGVQLYLFDVLEQGERSRLFDSTEAADGQAINLTQDTLGVSALSETQKIETRGREWRLVLKADDGYVASRRSLLPWGALLTGPPLSLLLALYLMTLVNQRENIRRQVLRQTERLQESRQRIRIIVDHVVDGILTIDEHGEIANVNQSVIQTFGYAQEELVGKNVSMLMTGPDRARHDFHINAYMAGGPSKAIGISRELVGLRKNGQTFPLELGVARATVEGKPVFIGSIRDISERRKAEKNLQSAVDRANAELKIRERVEYRLRQQTEALAKSNKELEQFAYVASHDLQEPLRKVQAFGDRLREKYGEVIEDRGRDYLTRMQGAAERMSLLIDDLLTFSRVSTQDQKLEAVNLNDVVEGVLGDLEIAIRESGARIEVDDLPLIEADALQMQQMFQNLIGNALKYRQEGRAPVIKISSAPVTDGPVDENGDYLFQAIQVKDNGIGFQQKYAGRIIEIFQRLHAREDYPGTGVGLSIVRKIADRHGGSLTAEGEPGVGAIFTITLSVQSQNDPAPAQQE